jgi:hypothetical protein
MPIMLGGAAMPVRVSLDDGPDTDPQHRMGAAQDQPIDD